MDLDDYLDPAFVAKFYAKTRAGKWGCVEWHGARNRGYGVFFHDGSSLVAHRVAWIIHHRKLIDGYLVVDHLCCNKGCVNWEHIEAVTSAENIYRMMKPVKGWVLVGNKYPRRRRLKIGKK
jgi:hypothetical protein